MTGSAGMGTGGSALDAWYAELGLVADGLALTDALLDSPTYGTFYEMRPELPGLIKTLLGNLDKKKRTAADKVAAGFLLEGVATCVVMGLCGSKGVEVDSYRSATAQLDLFCVGSTHRWAGMCRVLKIPPTGIVVECKATASKVDDATFARLCSLLHMTFANQASLGVFFAVRGATGFPDAKGIRQSKLGDARLRQALFYARTDKPIVVLTRVDLEKLAAGANFVGLLRAHILDVEKLGGFPALAGTDCSDTAKDAQLPEHIRRIVEEARQ